MIIYVNTVILSGSLLDDPEVTSHETSEAAGSRTIKKAKFRLQFSTSNTVFSDILVTCWGRQAEDAEKFLKRGSSVVVGGLLRGYENSYEITVKTLTFDEAH